MIEKYIHSLAEPNGLQIFADDNGFTVTNHDGSRVCDGGSLLEALENYRKHFAEHKSLTDLWDLNIGRVLKIKVGKFGQKVSLEDYKKEEIVVPIITHVNFSKGKAYCWLKSFGLIDWCVIIDL